MTDLFKEVLPSIMHNKKDLSNDEGFEKSYNSYIVNKALSFHLDCIMAANEMNKYHHLPVKMQYSYLLNRVRGYKRPFKTWEKRETIDDLEAIKEYYNYSNEKAKEALVLLNANQIKEIKKAIDKGGINDSKPRRVR